MYVLQDPCIEPMKFGIAPKNKSTKSEETFISIWVDRLRGNVCPARARRATFLSTIRLQPKIYPLMEKAPQIDHDGLRTFPTKHIA